MIRCIDVTYLSMFATIGVLTRWPRDMPQGVAGN